MNKYTAISLIVFFLIGSVIGFYLKPNCDKSIVDQGTNKAIDLKEKEIEKLSLKIDSLNSLKSKIFTYYDTIEKHHESRKELPFAINDTGARIEFFSKRYPNLFAGTGN